MKLWATFKLIITWLVFVLYLVCPDLEIIALTEKKLEHFSKWRVLDVLTSWVPAWLVTFESTLLYVPAYEILWSKILWNWICHILYQYTNVMEKAKFIILDHHIKKFSKLEKPIYNSEVPDKSLHEWSKDNWNALCFTSKRKNHFWFKERVVCHCKSN